MTVGVTEIVPDTVAPVALAAAVKVGWFPVPDAPKPIAVFEFDHAVVPPTGLVVNVPAGTDAPGQYDAAAGTVTVGIGLIVMV